MARGISTAAVARRASAIAIAVAAAAGLSACGAGQVTQTASKQTAIAGVNVDQGDLALRDLQVEYDSPEGYEAGDDAPMRVWISNEGTEAISLVGVATEAAEAVVLVSGEAAPSEEETTEASAEDEETTDAPESEDETTTEPDEDEATEEPTEEATTEAPAEEESAGEAEFDIEIAPSSYVRLDMASESGEYLLLEGLSDSLVSGGTVQVTFQFSNGEEVTVNLPVGQATAQETPSRVEHPGAGH